MGYKEYFIQRIEALGEIKSLEIRAWPYFK